MNFTKQILITGGAGFIGSHLVRLYVAKYPDYLIVNLDCLTYAGNLNNLSDIEKSENYRFEKVDITDVKSLEVVFQKYDFDAVIHLAAESHVDRSISGPMAFVQTNIIGTVNLLNCCRSSWDGNFEDKLFYHVSTDEVFGSLGEEGLFTETTAYDPRSPYSASKASSDHLVWAYHHTYGLPVKMSNCSNNYGSHQFPEKLIPLMINNIKNNQPLPIYGTGENIRDWLWVEDHASAIDVIFHKATIGESYNIGGLNEWTNIQLVKTLCAIMDEKLSREPGTSEKLITYVQDRAGHDMRYAIDASKIEQDLGWKPSIDFKEGSLNTVDWYLNHSDWIEAVTSGAYEDYYNEHYS